MYALTAHAHATASPTPTPVDQGKREAAQTLARALPDPSFTSSLIEEFDKTPRDAEKLASLNDVINRYRTRHPEQSSAFSVTAQENPVNSLRHIDEALLAYKGIEKLSSGLLQIHLYQPQGQPMAPVDVSRALVAYQPSGNETEWTVVEAFDNSGNTYRLDPHKAPSFPVLIVGVDGKEDLRAGVMAANQVLVSSGLQGATSMNHRLAANANASPEASADTARLDRISLKDDKEPWVAGDAEVYALVSGLQSTQAKPQIELIDMPYLTHDQTTYTPGQILINWQDYRYGVANVHLYEHDDNTNYKDLAVALATSVEAIVGVIKPEYALVATIGKTVLRAMPYNWFQNNDDYLDSFYAVEKDVNYTNYVGAARNATLTLTSRSYYY
jgi:hypothetical protein